MKTNDLFRASGVMAIGTILSRITGFFRAILAVAVLGTALLADSYNVANTMPNILYNLLVGGALTAIFVPQLVRSFSDEDGGHGFASRLVTTISGILLLLVLVGVIFAPALVRLYAPEFATTGFEKEFDIAVAFTRYCLPQIFFLGLFTMLGQVANARGSFAPLMWAPIANNLVVIVIFAGVLIMQKNLTVENISDGQIQLLGWGTTLGIVVQALILIPVVKRSGIRLRPIFGVAGLGKSFSLAGWTLVYVLISQLGYLITVNVATSAAVRSAQAGITTGVGFTPFTSAYYIMLLPYSIVTISIVTALLPHLSKLAIEKNCVSLYPDFAVFSDYILNFYKDYTIDNKLVELRNQVKLDPNSFLVQGRKKFIERNYPNIKLDYINDDLLPNYKDFFAKNAEYFVFSPRSEKSQISYLVFIIGSIVLFLLGIYFLKK
jgi:putative peptidoglycan lipid II flippase